MIEVKRKLILFSFGFLFLSIISESFDEKLVKASFIPMSDVMPLRYNYNKNFEKEDIDSWDFDFRLAYRFQQNFNEEKLASMIFSNSNLSALTSSNKFERI